MFGNTRPWSRQVNNVARLIGAALAAAALAVPASAFAEVGAPQGTVQQAAADALFLQYAPAPPTQGIVCLIDSGADPNPDTAPIVGGSTAIDGSTDTSDELAKLDPPVQPGNHASGHGTTMAMVMAAPENGWGMVGIAPTSVHVYNVKTLRPGQTTFQFADILTAIRYCTSLTSSQAGLAVINLSLGASGTPSQANLAALQSDVADARNHGLNVVAAAGNNGGSVWYPAATNGVFAVGGADANPANLGVTCPFSNRGPQLQVLAPACGTESSPVGLELAFEDGTPELANGTSAATAQVSAVIASIRAYNPTIGVTQAEQCITATEVRGGNLDTAAAFRACGLGAIVDQGNAAYQAANTPPASQPEPPTLAAAHDPTSEPVLPRPRLAAVSFRHHILSLRALNLPAGARMRVSVQRRGGGEFRPLTTVRARTVATARAALQVTSWDRLLVRYLDPGGPAAPSPAATVTPARHSNWNTRPIEFLP